MFNNILSICVHFLHVTVVNKIVVGMITDGARSKVPLTAAIAFI